MSKKVIITGTSRGIGFELARLFAEAGHQVLALSRNAEPIQKLNNSNIHSFPFDITKEEDQLKVAKYVENSWNTVDILINNAGLLINKAFLKLSQEDFKRVYDVNVFGIVRLMQSILPFAKSGAHIVNVSSMGGVQGSAKFGGLAAYSTSKAAIITLNELLAEEFKDSGIAFNSLALGAVQTEMLQEAFPGYEAPVSAREMAEYIKDFALKGQKFYNGKVLPVAVTTP